MPEDEEEDHVEDLEAEFRHHLPAVNTRRAEVRAPTPHRALAHHVVLSVQHLLIATRILGMKHFHQSPFSAALFVGL